MATTSNDTVPAYILSVRSTHLDEFAPRLVKEFIMAFTKVNPNIPVTFCFEITPGVNMTPEQRLNQLIDYFKDKDVSRDPSRPYTDEERAHDLAIFWMLKAVRLSKIKFVPIDTQDVAGIPLGDPRAEQLKPKRRAAMAKNISEVANKVGGLIIDFGGISHTPILQQLMAADKNMAAYKKIFCCAYSVTGQHHMDMNLRLAQFMGGVSKSDYPFGLNFISPANASVAPGVKLSSAEQEKVVEKLIQEFIRTQMESITTLLKASTFTSLPAELAEALNTTPAFQHHRNNGNHVSISDSVKSQSLLESKQDQLQLVGEQLKSKFGEKFLKNYAEKLNFTTDADGYVVSAELTIPLAKNGGEKWFTDRVSGCIFEKGEGNQTKIRIPITKVSVSIAFKPSA